MTDNMEDMPRRRGISRSARRQLTLETTLASLGRKGAEGTSLRSVCRDMEVSPALLTHSFSGWHEVLVCAYELMAAKFVSRMSPLLTAPLASERARLREMMTVYMANDWGGENTVGTVLAFWQLSRTVAELKEPFGGFLENRHRLMSRAVILMAGEARLQVDTELVTLELILMMDGLWLHMSLNPGWIPAQRALELCWNWINDRLAVPARVAEPAA